MTATNPTLPDKELFTVWDEHYTDVQSCDRPPFDSGLLHAAILADRSARAPTLASGERIDYEWVDEHTLTSGDIPPNVRVILASSVERMLDLEPARQARAVEYAERGAGSMTPESIPSGALKVAEECKRLVVAALKLAESTMPPFNGVTPGQHAICATLDAIDRLAALASPSPATGALTEDEHD